MIRKGLALRLALLLIVGLGLLAGATLAQKGTPKALAAANIRWGFYVTYNPNSLDSLRANVDKLNYVSPWYYTTDKTGRLNGVPQPEVNVLLRSKGVKNMPMIRNSAQYNDFHDVLYNQAKRDGLIAQLRSAVQANNYDGITIDWEGINAADESGVTSFMAALHQVFQADNKLVAMAVPPKARDVNTGWAGPYNYRNLRDQADYFIIMAYDQHYPGGSPGPVAAYPWLNDVAGYVSNTLGANKTLWGIGLYGYDWNTSVTPKVNADPRTWREAQALAKQYNAPITYDAVNHALTLVYSKDNQRHEVWFEDKRSFDAKVGLVQKNNFAGYAMWRLGQEDPAIWNSVSGGSPAPTPTSTPVTLPTPVIIPSPTPAPAAPNVCAPVAPFQSNATSVYFPQTQHSLKGGFLTYWLSHGGLSVFGYPLTEEFAEKSATDGKTYTVQYFERNRFEWHPENKGTPQEFQLGLLGVQFTTNRFFPLGSALNNYDPNGVFFQQTQHALQGGFLSAWNSKGGLEQFGYPLSDAFPEVNGTDGKTYTVQYFERARFEYHPENAGDQSVQLGLLGTWALKQRGCGQ